MLGLALLLWGWRVDQIWLGVAFAVLVELGRLGLLRIEMGEKEFSRVSDLCTALGVGGLLLLRFASQDTAGLGLKYVRWLPALFFPLAFAQELSQAGSVPLRSLSLLLRRRKQPSSRRFDVAWPYFMLCLVSAGAANTRDLGYFFGIAGLALWTAWHARPRRLAFPVWIGVALTCLGVAYGLQYGLRLTQAFLEGRLSDLVSRFARKEFDALESRTAMGRVGTLKQSPRLVLKIRPVSGEVPSLVRQAAYNTYRDEVWRASQAEFDPVSVESDLTSWTLAANAAATTQIRVVQRLNKGKGLLSLPLGSTAIRNLPVDVLETNALGAARTAGGPDMVEFSVAQGDAPADQPPGELDLVVPEAEVPALAEVVNSLGLRDLGSHAKIEALESYFSRNFTYSTYQAVTALGMVKGRTPMANFLLSRRSGHCEFFASATVLLLRHLDIPARYAVGYAVAEKNAAGTTYYVREKDAHAWVLAWVDGRWTEVDTTPGSWREQEAMEAGLFRGFQETLSWLAFGFSEWRWLGGSGWLGAIAPWLMLPVVLYLGWRVFGRARFKGKGNSRQANQVGADSEWYEVERALASIGLPKESHESALQYLRRLPSRCEIPESLVQLHYRHRFGVDGLPDADRAALRESATSLANRLRAQTGSDQGR